MRRYAKQSDYRLHPTGVYSVMRYCQLIITALFGVCIVIAGFAAMTTGIFALGIVLSFQNFDSGVITPPDFLLVAELTMGGVIIAVAYGFIAWHCWRIRSNYVLQHLRFLHRQSEAFARIFTTLAVSTGIVCAVLTAYRLGATCEQGNCDAHGMMTFGLLAVASELAALACYCWRIR